VPAAAVKSTKPAVEPPPWKPPKPPRADATDGAANPTTATTNATIALRNIPALPSVEAAPAAKDAWALSWFNRLRSAGLHAAQIFEIGRSGRHLIPAPPSGTIRCRRD
jgi:hypothetical protein